MKRTDPAPARSWAAYASHLGGYMRRWILRTPWGTLRVHNILESDEGRDFHDHPFNFTSIILRGGYIEHRPGCGCSDPAARASDLGPCLKYLAPAIVRRKAVDFHRLELLGGPAWTFVISSRYFRNWGFLRKGQWVPYQEYHRSYYNGAES